MARHHPDLPLPGAALYSFWFQAAARLAEAAKAMGSSGVAVQLRYLQTLTEISSGKTSTIVFPLPIDLIRPLLGGDSSLQSRETPEAPHPPE